MAKVMLQRLVLGPIQTNCYLLHKEGEKELIVVDPAEQADEIRQAAKEMGASVGAVLLTHGHFDHIGAVGALQKDGAKVYAGEEERALLDRPEHNLSGMNGGAVRVQADHYLADGEVFTTCGLTIRTLATPGHTQGGVCYYLEEQHVLFSGDTLFAGSVGRTDFPTGNMMTLLRSVKEKLSTLPGETGVYPGHGPATTIAEEQMTNRYMV